MGHTHSSTESTPEAKRLGRHLLLTVVLPFALVTLWALWALRVTDTPDTDIVQDNALVTEEDLHDALVIGTALEPCVINAGPEFLCHQISVRLLEGPDEGQKASLEILPAENAPSISKGDEIVLLDTVATGYGEQYTYWDHVRRPPLIWLSALFVITVLIFGRWKGAGALIGFAITILVITQFLVPAILGGADPLQASLTAAAAMLLTTLYLTHGLHLQTTVALIGTMIALAITAILAKVFVETATITGLATNEGIFVQIGTRSIDLQGIILGGVIIGSLGVLDDVTVTQASTVQALHRTDPRLSFAQLYQRSIRVGRDHIASTVNTLILAYAGASLPLFLLFELSGSSFRTIVNGETVALEIIRSFTGSIGLIAAVPITTAIAAAATTATRKKAQTDHDAEQAIAWPEESSPPRLRDTQEIPLTQEKRR